MASLIRNIAGKFIIMNGQKAVINSVLQRSFQTSFSVMAPRVQGLAPDFQGTAVVNHEFKDIRLADFKGRYLVLFFYPLDFTFVCPTEIIAFSERMGEFKALNTEVIGVSTDSHFSHLAWINTPRKAGGLGSLNYPLLSDFNKKISQDYSVLLEQEGVALRGLFIIDAKGIIRQITINDLPVGRSVDETLRLIKAFQFVEQHGEVCPANWKPNDPTIKPDPVSARAYFDKATYGTREIAPEERAKKIASEDIAKKIASEDRAKKIAPEDRAKKIAPEERAKKIASEDKAKNIASEEVVKKVRLGSK